MCFCVCVCVCVLVCIYVFVCAAVAVGVFVCVRVTFAGQAVGGDPGQAVPADVTEGGPCVGASVPVVHP